MLIQVTAAVPPLLLPCHKVLLSGVCSPLAESLLFLAHIEDAREGEKTDLAHTTPLATRTTEILAACTEPHLDVITNIMGSTAP